MVKVSVRELGILHMVFRVREVAIASLDLRQILQLDSRMGSTGLQSDGRNARTLI